MKKYQIKTTDMLRKLLLTVSIMLTINMLAWAQSGTLKGKIKDKTTGEGVPFASVVIEAGGSKLGSTTTDFDGNYTIKPIPPGKYDVKASYVGYKPQMVMGVVMKADNITFLDISMESTVINIETFEVVDYAIPLIDKDGGSKDAIDAKQISKMPGRSVDAVLSTMGGVYTDDGKAGSVRGARESGTVTYVDGVKVMGSATLPNSAIEQVSMMTGGLPAQYGDATGGVVNITTKGPSRSWGGGMELLTSELTDKYGYNLLGFSVQGPLLMVKDKKDPTLKNPLLGFFLSGELKSEKDQRPSSIGETRLNETKLAELQATPLIGIQEGDQFQIKQSGEFLRKSDMVTEKWRNDANSKSASFSGKIDVKTTKNTNLTFGGSYDYQKYRYYIFQNSLVNSSNNPERTLRNYRVFGRFVQKFPNSNDPNKKEKQLIKNVYYSLQADYSNQFFKQQDPELKDNLFAYGHVGKFTTTQSPNYSSKPELDSASGKTMYLLSGYSNTIVDFTPSTYNPDLAAYSSYVMANANPLLTSNIDVFKSIGGLRNGDAPNEIYNYYSNVGQITDYYGISNNSQIGFNANGSADIGNHAIQLGFQYEQRIDRSYSYNPVGLWNQMRLLVNKHITELDKSNPHIVMNSDFGQEVIVYDRKFVQGSQAFVDYNIRKKENLATNGLDYINIDSYDPSFFSIDMFSADELLNSGKELANYYGYDYKGNLLKDKPSFDDYFTQKDEYGNYTRPLSAYEPIYVAGYLQDKFAFNDLIFNIGVRVDAFDANQKVLKDPYSIYELKTASQVATEQAEKTTIAGSIPSNIGNDYAVYVDDIKNPSKYTGFRNGSTWYNAEGAVISDPTVLYGSGGIAPMLSNPSQNEVNSSAFEDYTPQINVLPRIAFSFPISDEALFFAHYDVLSKRPDPENGVRLNPADYLFIYSRGNNTLNNPDQQPEKTIDYELGFQQVLGKTSSMKIAAYYRELRNMAQVVRMNGAYPVSYTTMGNVDFGTVKGMTISYDLRQTKNVWMRASYTLQFADGTGSSSTSASNLINAGQPNLRTISPLSFDRRHAITTVVDYRYGSGKDYNGPKITRKSKDASGNETSKTLKLLENTGANVTFTYGSGTPYSRQSNITSLFGGTPILQGQINGSRMPGQFKVDARIDRDIYFHAKKKENGGKEIYMNVYVQILNVLNAKNIRSVYRATGNPDDDGYLASAENQSGIQSQTDTQSFRDLYSIAINNPYNYSMPRTIRLGVQLNF